MGFEFRPAIREQTSLLIALAGPSGSGKTFSALRLARGLVGQQGRIAVIDTEAGRALHYADRFQFHHGDLKPPFRPEAYLNAILAAEAAGFHAVVIDSMSHEYEGEGGILDWAAELEEKGTKPPGNWNVPKGAHKKMMNRLLQLRCHLIFCLRADEKVKIEKQPDNQGRMKTVVVPIGWQPICEKRFMYEMTASFTLTADRPGMPQFNLPHKLQDQHRHAFPEGRHIGEESGEQLAAWAHGGVAPAAKAAPGIAPETKAAGEAASAQGVDKYTAWLAGLDPAVKETVRPFHKDWSARAKAADEAAKSAAPRPWSFQPEQGAVMPCNSAAEFATLMQATIPGAADIGLLMGYNATMLDRLDEIEPERYAAIVEAATQKGWVG